MAKEIKKPDETSGSGTEFEKNNRAARIVGRIFITTVLLLATLAIGAISVMATQHFIAIRSDYRETRAENDSLRRIARGRTSEPSDSIEAEALGNNAIMELSEFDLEMLEINSDYVCWITIDGTNVDHPVVRGHDNDKYIYTSFYGENNALGALFMDYRNSDELSSNVIIYGHNSVQGEMFGDLHLLLDESFLNEHNIITIEVFGKIFEYEIYSARVTDIYDSAYTLSFETNRDFTVFAYENEAPLQARNILTLSTCVSRDNDDARLIVQAFSLSNESIFG